jgi:hypothetical protein
LPFPSCFACALLVVGRVLFDQHNQVLLAYFFSNLLRSIRAFFFVIHACCLCSCLAQKSLVLGMQGLRLAHCLWFCVSLHDFWTRYWSMLRVIL